VTQITDPEDQSNRGRRRRDHGDRRVPRPSPMAGRTDRNGKGHDVSAILFEQFGLEARPERRVRRLGAQHLRQARGKTQQRVAALVGKRPIAV
jgi:hypothetical protein